jgi:DNA-binding MarR family transcriptional regulator
MARPPATPSPAPPAPLDDDPVALRVGIAWRELRRGSGAAGIRRLLYAGLPVELEQGQADTLLLLVRQGEQRMRDVADGLRVDRSTATRAVDRLVDMGLAERSTSAADGRGVVVRATGAGVALHAALVERYHGFLRAVLDAFEPAEQEQLAALLERLVARVDELVATPA